MTKHTSFSGRNSLRGQILIFTIGMILVTVLAIGCSFWAMSNTILRKNQIGTGLNAVSHAAYTVQKDLSGLEEMMDNLFVDRQIQSILSEEIASDYDRTLQWNHLSYALNVYERQNYFQYINCIVFYNSEGHAHIFSYMEPNTRIYVRRNQELEWYQDALVTGGRLLWDRDVVASKEAYAPYATGSCGTDISVMRALRDERYRAVQGAVYVSIRPMYLSVMQKNNGLEGMDVYLYDATGRLLTPGMEREDADSWSSCLEKITWRGRECRYCMTEQNIVYESKIEPYGFRLIAVQPVERMVFMDSNIMVLGAVVLLLMALVVTSLWGFLSIRVIRPVHVLADTMKRVHTEGLSVRAQGGSSSEFSYLAENLNDMLAQTQLLMQKNIEKERAIQEAEHKVVLAQLNPHFVYNALFAIRMMAVMQKAENIQDMVDALWRMLKNSVIKGDEMFSLGEEIQNVRDYLHVLSAMNVQKYEVLYEIAPELLKEPCPRFLIQPVVENAIMHGILPKQGFSTIRIQAACEQDMVVITVSNDGLPIPEERLAEVRGSLSKEQSAHKGIGLGSIRQRLRLLYGDQGDLVIVSTKEPERTIVTIRYPRKGEYHVSGDHSR